MVGDSQPSQDSRVNPTTKSFKKKCNNNVILKGNEKGSEVDYVGNIIIITIEVC